MNQDNGWKDEWNKKWNDDEFCSDYSNVIEPSKIESFIEPLLSQEYERGHEDGWHKGKHEWFNEDDAVRTQARADERKKVIAEAIVAVEELTCESYSEDCENCTSMKNVLSALQALSPVEESQPKT